MSPTTRLAHSSESPLFHIGGTPARVRVRPHDVVEADCEDAFGGRLVSTSGRPRELAPFPDVNPLTGPIHIDGARPGDGLAVHLLSVEPLRSWGVSTQSPDFGLLSGTAATPNLQPPLEERVWIWQLDAEARTLTSAAPDGTPLRIGFRPFLGILGVAPAHGEVRNSVVPGPFGGNLDLPAVAPGATIYVRVNEPGALLVVGDGHLAQGDGEFGGTAVEGAVRARLVCDVVAPDQAGDWPRIETDDELVTVGCGRPLESAFAVAVHQMTRWVSDLSGLPAADALQLVSQTAVARVGNLVNPQYSAAVAVKKSLVPRIDRTPTAHERLRARPPQPGES